MSGTIDGGRKARDTNISKYGPGFYKKIGSKGGKLGRTGGFYADRDLARTAGAKGGRKSRRSKSTEHTVVTTDMSNADAITSYEKLPSEPTIRQK